MKTYLVDIACKECGKLFHPRRATTKFCSRLCSHKHLFKNNSTFYRENMKRTQKFGVKKCQKISDKEMLRVWEEYKAGGGSISLELLFKRKAGYSVRPDKLKRLVGKIEYMHIMRKFNNKGRIRYIKGRQLECKIRTILEPKGYYVIRSGGSKGLFDVIAIPLKNSGNTTIKCIQSKSNRKPCSKELNKIKEISLPEYCEKEVWIWIDQDGFKTIKV